MTDVISNVKIYGLADSIKASKYPMSVDVSSLNCELTDTVKKLGSAKPGTGHDNFLNGIIAQFDLTFTVKAWTEAQRYHWFEFISSQSQQHKITKFDLDKQYSEYVDPRIIDIMKDKVLAYNLESDLELKNEIYLKILYSNPAGFRLTARMTTNYRQLKTMVMQRENHRLPEWKRFCEQVKEFTHFMELCFTEGE